MFSWAQHFADWVVYGLFAIAPGHLASSVDFFIFDTIKLFVLLAGITLIMGTVNSYLPVDAVRDFLTKRRLYGFDYLFAAIFGVITPFCSCSSVPIFIGFVKGGIPLGITFTYLITAPLVNEVALAVFAGSFGLRITGIYVATGMVMGIAGGYALGRMRLERYLSPWIQQLIHGGVSGESATADKRTFKERAPQIAREALLTVKGIAPYIVLGIGIGAAMHGFLPTGFFEAYIRKDQWFAVPLAVAMGVPMYSNAAGVLPVVEVLVAKGIPLGTAIAFMMGVIGLSLPEALLLKKIMTWRLVGIYFGTLAAFMIMAGYLFNAWL
ncbi:MAG: permease [Turneriella sp.]